MSGEERKRDVVEAPEKKAGSATPTEVSRSSQEKSPEQMRQEREREEQRMKGKTPSSAGLPGFELLTKPVDQTETEHKAFKPPTAKAPADQSHVELDKNGKVEYTVNPKGKRTDYQYDEKDQLKKVTFSDKYSYQKKDGAWGEYDPDGNKVRDLGKGEVTIDKEGTLTWVGENGTIKTSHLDSSRVTINPDQSQVGLDKDGRVEFTVNPKGKRTDYKYDDKDQLTKATFSDKYSYRKQDDGTWGEYDPSGKKVKDLGKGEVTVDKDGTLAWIGENGTVKISHLDSSRVTINPDQSQVGVDKDGRVEFTLNPQGKRTDYQYDDNNKDQLTKVTFSDKFSYRKQDDGSWGEYDPDGNKVKDLGKGDVAIDKDGTLIWSGEDGTVKTHHLDGSKVVIKPDQSQVGRDRDGKLKFAVSPDGKRTDY